MIDKNNKKTQEKTACYCPYLDLNTWDEQEHNWVGKQFYKITYRCFLYEPRDLTEKLTAGYQDIIDLGYGLIPDGLKLYQNKMFSGECLIEIKKGSIYDRHIKTFRSSVYSKVYIGPYRDLVAVRKTFNFNPLNIYEAYFSCSICTPNPKEQKTVLIGERPYS